MATASATEDRIHRRARKLRKLAERRGIGPLFCAGDGMLVADLPADIPHFTVAQFCSEAAEVLGGSVELVGTAAVAGHRVPDQIRSPHAL